jgi:uncharacterized membrane protein|tara:strand:+ start:893 stop:1399 length:507 start_codon:yes stop_codon:yes gene_type:complete
MKAYLKKFFERGLSIAAFIFPLIEISYYFGPKVFTNTDSLALKLFYFNYLTKVTRFYEANVYLIFIFMVAVFITCSRGTLPLNKYVRFNIIQAILLNIICSCVGACFAYMPIVIRESTIGFLLTNSIFLGMLTLIVYSIILILYGRYPKIPVVSEAAKLQVQRGYSDY